MFSTPFGKPTSAIGSVTWEPSTTCFPIIHLSLPLRGVFASGGNLQLYPIHGNSATKDFLYNDYGATIRREGGQSFWLAPSEAYQFDVEEMNEIVIEKNRYYRPKTRNFATIDSIFLYDPLGADPVLFMFQITQAKGGHDTKPKGLILMDGLKLLPKYNNVRRIYVVVTPELTYPKIAVPKDYYDSSGPLEVFIILSSPTKFSRVELSPKLGVRKTYAVVTPELTYPKITVPKDCHDPSGPLEVFHHPVIKISRRVP